MQSLRTDKATEEIIIPQSFLGFTEGPDIASYQRLVTLTVELKDRSLLRVAIPRYAIDMPRAHVKWWQRFFSPLRTD